MPGAADAEIYFIAAMMVLILVVCTVTVYFFFRQYKKEMREKAERMKQKATRESTNAGAADAAKE